MTQTNKLFLGLGLGAVLAYYLWEDAKHYAKDSGVHVLPSVFTDNQSEDTALPIGVRRNNPFNLDYSASNNWVGAVRPHDGIRQERFKSVEYGVRAYILLIKNYMSKHGCNNIYKIINRYAPPKENDTNDYINFVVSQTGVSAVTPLRFEYDTLKKLALAQSKMEVGHSHAITEKQFNTAWSMLNA